MAQEKKLIPKRRFKEFQNAEEWEQSELNDLCSIVTKQTGFDYSAFIKPSLLRYEDEGTYPFIQNKDFNGTKINMETDFYIPQMVANKFPNILLDRPSILISISGKIGNVGLYLSSMKAFIGGAVGICKLLDESNGSVILNQLLSPSGQEHFTKSIKASSHQNITVEDIRKMQILIPKHDNEKKLIGSLFDKLDNLITLHQRKLEKIKSMKKAYLYEMFPAQGESKPKRRFKGFTDDWILCELSDETNSIDTGRSKFISKNDGKYKILGSTSVIGYDDNYDYEGDFLLTARVGANAGEVYRHSGKVKISDNTVFIQGENLDFTYYMLMNFDIKKLAFGTGQPLVKASELKQLRLMFPMSEEEKIKIGIFFKNIDHLISLHQSKLDKLKNLKKAYLNEMFI